MASAIEQNKKEDTLKKAKQQLSFLGKESPLRQQHILEARDSHPDLASEMESLENEIKESSSQAEHLVEATEKQQEKNRLTTEAVQQLKVKVQEQLEAQKKLQEEIATVQLLLSHRSKLTPEMRQKVEELILTLADGISEGGVNETIEKVKVSLERSNSTKESKLGKGGMVKRTKSEFRRQRSYAKEDTEVAPRIKAAVWNGSQGDSLAATSSSAVITMSAHSSSSSVVPNATTSPPAPNLPPTSLILQQSISELDLDKSANYESTKGSESISLNEQDQVQPQLSAPTPPIMSLSDLATEKPPEESKEHSVVMKLLDGGRLTDQDFSSFGGLKKMILAIKTEQIANAPLIQKKVKQRLKTIDPHELSFKEKLVMFALQVQDNGNEQNHGQ